MDLVLGTMAAIICGLYDMLAEDHGLWKESKQRMFSSPAMTQVCLASHLILFLKIYKRICLFVCLFVKQVNKGAGFSFTWWVSSWRVHANVCFWLPGLFPKSISSSLPASSWISLMIPRDIQLPFSLTSWKGTAHSNCLQFGFPAALGCTNTSGTQYVTHIQLCWTIY